MIRISKIIKEFTQGRARKPLAYPDVNQVYQLNCFSISVGITGVHRK